MSIHPKYKDIVFSMLSGRLVHINFPAMRELLYQIPFEDIPLFLDCRIYSKVTRRDLSNVWHKRLSERLMEGSEG